MECHYKEACSGLQRGEQRQGIWACGVCVVVSGEVAPPQPQSSQVPPPAPFSQPFGQPGSLPSQTGSNSQTNLHHLAHQIAPGGVLCWFSPPLGEEVGLVLLPQTLGMAGVLSLEVALVLELGFPPSLDLGLAPGTSPFLCLSIPW
jgi:hypothetical protein